MERNTEIEERTASYLAMYQQIRAMVPSEAIALALLQEIRKDMRMDRMKTERSVSNNGDSPATGSQIAYLEKLGVAVPENLTKKEASQLIDAALGNGNSQGDGAASEPIRMPRRIP